MRYFQRADSFEEHVFTLQHYKDELAEGEETEIILEEQKRDVGGEMYCCLHDTYPSFNDGCGRIQCGNDYQPRNGKNGCCKNLRSSYIETGRKFRLTKEGLKEIEAGTLVAGKIPAGIGETK